MFLESFNDIPRPWRWEVASLAKKEIRTAIDIGSATVRALVAEGRPDGSIQIVGAGTSPSAGLRKGVVVDIEAVSAAIADAVARAENLCGCVVVSATMGIGGSHVASVASKGMTVIGSSDREIRKGDVERALQSSQSVPIAPDREIVQVIPREYVIDDCRGIRRPVGMSGVRLEVETQVITGSSTAIQNVNRAAARANLNIDGMLLQSAASAEAVLNDDEREHGVVMLDVGAATTDIAVYTDGGLLYAGIVPIGGGHITNDIAYVLKTPLGYSEDLKLRYGAATAEGIADDELCGNDMGISRRKLCQIIEARVNQLFEKVREELYVAGVDEQLLGGAVITGGSARLKKIVESASRGLDMPARLGSASGIGGLQEIVSSPEYSTAIGLAMHAWRQSAPVQGRSPSSSNGFLGAVFEWFRDVFSS